MIDQLLAAKGFDYGSGTLSPNQIQFVVNIPKNASSFILSWLTQFEWHPANIKNHFANIGEIIVIVRDPLERWISGISQYLNTYILSVAGPNGPIFPGQPVTEFDYVMSADDFIRQYNQTVERLLFDVIDKFDDHTWSQSYFFQYLYPEKRRTYFYMDDDFTEKISSYLNLPVDTNSSLDYNSSKSNLNIKLLQNFFQQRLVLRPELKDRIFNAYHKDYTLINSVTFQ
jgi:hypothetical protein